MAAARGGALNSGVLASVANGEGRLLVALHLRWVWMEELASSEARAADAAAVHSIVPTGARELRVRRVWVLGGEFR